MVQLFEQDIKTNDRQSSKGNQLKWCRNNVWYKADYMGYEGLVEYVVSRLLEKSSLKQEEYVLYKCELENGGTVTSKGVVKGIKKGTATITVQSGSKKLTCKVTVK